MFRLGLSKSFTFNADSIDAAVKIKAAGGFALGTVDDAGDFQPKYVGWAPDDLKGELKGLIDPRYTVFKYAYALTPRDAFEKICRIFHDLGGDIILDNTEHPPRPQRVKWRCPVCDK